MKARDASAKILGYLRNPLIREQRPGGNTPSGMRRVALAAAVILLAFVPITTAVFAGTVALLCMM